MTHTSDGPLLHKGLPPLPLRICKLPCDSRGFPVPWFVARYDGVEPDFRVVDPSKIVRAVKDNRCWVCGEKKGVHHAFVIGPMCAVNRVVSEPPSHLDCALFSAQACPFLAKPRMRRNEKDLPEHRHAGGIPLLHNPGAVCVWVTRSYKLFNPGNGVLFQLGEPERVYWFVEGRRARRDEIITALDKGLPALRELAESQGPAAVSELNKYVERVMPLVPEAVS